jgi:putative molybdopterin biosynthesis protein
LPRDKAQGLFWDKLTDCGYFEHVPTEEVTVSEALGRVTAENIYAVKSVPHYNGAAMDGIAVRSQDTFGAGETTPKQLTILSAGQPFELGGCYIVDTGDLLPPGTNAVIMVEEVYSHGGKAEIIAAAAPWQHVRIIGEDVVAHELVLPEYHTVTPPDIAVLLAAGLNRITVVARPKVTVIPTGSELVATHEELKPGLILDVNSHMLCAAVTQWGGQPTRHEIVYDDFEKLKQAVKDSLAVSDVVITNAGTSAGTEDFTSRVLAELGEVLVHGVSIKPGKPVILAICQGKPVIGLPGYPVSALLTADLFVRDVLYARQKLAIPAVEKVSATMARQVYSHIGMEEFLRVSLGNIQGKLVAVPLGRGAGLISSLTKAQGVIAVPQDSGGLSAGSSVEVSLFNQRKTAEAILAIGSHDLALDILGIFLKRRTKQSLASANVGSMGGIMAVRNNEAHIAGIHMLDEQTGEYNVAYAQKYLAKLPYRLVHLARREQGLIVAPGNPKGITGIADLVHPDMLFINRQRGSGTRMLLDHLLKKERINPAQLEGYEKEAGTHMAVAASVAEGAADAGMGIRAAARVLGLDFIPVAYEQYDLLLNFEPDDQRYNMIIDILKSEEFRREVEALGGYDLKDAGALISEGGE